MYWHLLNLYIWLWRWPRMILWDSACIHHFRFDLSSLRLRDEVLNKLFSRSNYRLSSSIVYSALLYLNVECVPLDLSLWLDMLVPVLAWTHRDTVILREARLHTPHKSFISFTPSCIISLRASSSCESSCCIPEGAQCTPFNRWLLCIANSPIFTIITAFSTLNDWISIKLFRLSTEEEWLLYCFEFQFFQFDRVAFRACQVMFQLFDCLFFEFQ
jgi:hypothetical protein